MGGARGSRHDRAYRVSRGCGGVWTSATMRGGRCAVQWKYIVAARAGTHTWRIISIITVYAHRLERHMGTDHQPRAPPLSPGPCRGRIAASRRVSAPSTSCSCSFICPTARMRSSSCWHFSMKLRLVAMASCACSAVCAAASRYTVMWSTEACARRRARRGRRGAAAPRRQTARRARSTAAPPSPRADRRAPRRTEGGGGGEGDDDDDGRRRRRRRLASRRHHWAFFGALFSQILSV